MANEDMDWDAKPMAMESLPMHNNSMNNNVTPELFGSTDLIREIASYLVDDATTVLKLSVVSKSCHAAILDSPQLWKATCRHRWKSKWGFVKRWTTTLRDARRLEPPPAHLPPPDAATRRTPGTPGVVSGSWWRDKYTWQERDAKRLGITATELNSLTFDFRFWLSQFWGQGNLLASGLNWTASQDLQFTSRRSFQFNPEFTWPGVDRGMIQGHPSGRQDMEWFLDHDGKGLQWGNQPQLWPRGTIHRLDTWGWEIRNPNVCLRAMDIGVDRRTGQVYLIKTEQLWSDYLQRLQRFATDFDMPDEGIAYLEAPLEFWDFPMNRERFPRLGIDTRHG